MNISVDQWRTSIGLFHSATYIGSHEFRVWFSLFYLMEYLMKFGHLLQGIVYNIHSFFIECVCNSHFNFILFMLLFEAFDTEQNPGPVNIHHDLSVLHLNIRSIRNKIDYIKDHFLDFDILCFF